MIWAILLIKRWGRIWFNMGIGGTIVLMILYVLTRVPNPTTNGRALTINGVGYSYRNIPGGIYNIDENKEQYIQVKGNSYDNNTLPSKGLDIAIVNKMIVILI